MMMVDGVEVRLSGLDIEDPRDKEPLTMMEIKEYIKGISQGHPGQTLTWMELKRDPESADSYIGIRYALTGGKPFERIRRITGYLVGTMEMWNDAKKAEEHDRVKHSVTKMEDVE